MSRQEPPRRPGRKAERHGDARKGNVFPPTDEELDAWEERARGPKDWAAEDVLRLIAEIRRLREAQANAAGPARVVRDPERCGGDPILAGTRTAVHDVVSYFQLHGGDLGEVRQELPHLSREQIEVALAYYDAHKAKVEGILQRRREFVAQLPVAPVRK